MEIVEPLKLFAGGVLLLVGILFLWQAQGTRGFSQKKQAGALALIGARLLAAVGLGYLDFGGGPVG